MKPGEWFFCFDPLSTLEPEVRQRWEEESERRVMLAEAVGRAGGDVRSARESLASWS